MVLLTIYHGWDRRKSVHLDSERYLSYEELQASGNNWQYPEGWQFMARLEEEQQRSAEKRRETKEALKGVELPTQNGTESLDAEIASEEIRRNVGKQISQIAEDLRFQKETMDQRPIPPVLKIWKMRHSQPQTYEMEQDDWEFSDFEKQTGRRVNDVASGTPTGTPIRTQTESPTAPSTGTQTESSTASPTVAQTGDLRQSIVTARPSGTASRFHTPENQNPYFVFKTAESDPTEESKEPGELKKAPERKETVDANGNVADRTQERAVFERNDSNSQNANSQRASTPESRKKEFVDTEAPISLPDELSDSESWEDNNPDAPYDHEEGLLILRYFNQKARQRLASYSDEIHDYSYILYKWDQSNTSLDGQDVIWFKLREEPFSFYGRSAFPKKVEGREMLFWTGRYDQMLIVNTGAKALNRTLAFELDSNTVKKASPKGFGRLRFSELLREMEALSRDASKFQNTQIRYFKDAQVGDEKCYAIQITYDDRAESDVYRIQIYVTYSHDLPVKIVFYDWPRDGEPPEIQESYLFVITELNPGFQDIDFCHLNPSYGFKRYIPRLSETETDFMAELYQNFLERQNSPQNQ